VDLTEFLSLITNYINLSTSYLIKTTFDQFKPTLIILLILNKNTNIKIDCVSHLSIQLYATLIKLFLSIPTMVLFLYLWWFLKKLLSLSLTAINFPGKKSTL